MRPQTRAAAIVLVALLLVIVGALVVTRNRVPVAIGPSASVQPTVSIAAPSITTTTAPPATTSASPSANIAPADRYGFLALRGQGFDLMSESGAVIQQYGCGTAPCDFNVAASPDGKRVAYWRTGQTAQWELRIFEVSSPTNVQTAVTLPTSQRGGALAWSSDAQGILFAQQSVESFPAAGGGPKSACISTYEL